MASLLALHNELVSSIVRGFQLFRSIELANELAEELLLEARMVVANAWIERDGARWVPGPDEIRAACSVIQETWSDEERGWRRRGHAMKSAIVDDHQQSLLEKRRAWNRAYRDAHREKIAERDRAYKAANREKIAARKREIRAANARQRAAVA